MYIHETGNIFYDTETCNLSFLQVAQDLKSLGIKNNMFFLRLYDKGLQGIDPHGPITAMSTELCQRIMAECIRNPWYYLREVCRIPDQGNSKGIPYKLNRANLAATWCFVNNIDHYLTIPRQIGKTQSILANLTWAYLFGTTNSSFAFFATSQELASENLERLKMQRELLPPYLRLRQDCVIDAVLGTKDNEIDNIRKIYNPLTKNTIVTKAKATSKESAVKLGRGNTLPITYMDEAEFINYIDEIMMASGPAYSTAAANAERNGAAYCRILSSTPGDLDSPAGQAAQKILDKTCRWSEQFYDLGPEKAKEIIAANAENNIVYIEYSYKQLGLGEDWFRKLCKLVNGDPTAIKRELLLQRIRGSKDSPFSEEDLMAIQEIKPVVIEEHYIMDLYQLNVYKKLNPKVPYLVGVDVATGVNNDSTAVSVVNPYTLQIDAEFRSPIMGYPDLKRFLYQLVKKYIPQAVLCIEKNHGGDSVIQDLRETVLNRNIYHSMSKDLVDDNNAKINKGHIEREVERRRNYGVFTGVKSRSLMIDLLFLTVQEFKDRLTSHFVIDDILKLVRKNGKVQAAAGEHDDSIMSYLIALYVYTYGKNLNRWGIVKGMKEPGSEGDDNGAQEEDAYQYAMNHLSEDDMMFFQAQIMASQAANTYEQKIRKEAYEYSRLSEDIDKKINATTRVEDVEKEDFNYDYDKRETGSNPWVLNGFDDLNDW